MRTFVEVGMGVNRKRGYGQGFPFEAGDTYLGIDARYGMGAMGQDTRGWPILRPVVLNMDRLDELAKSSPTIDRTIRPNAQDLEHYAEVRELNFVTMYANWHQLPLQDNSVDSLLLSNIIGDPVLSNEYKTELLVEACRVVKPGQLVVAKETCASFTAQAYFAEHDQWEVSQIDPMSERWYEVSNWYDTHYRGIIFEVASPALQATVDTPNNLMA